VDDRRLADIGDPVGQRVDERDQVFLFKVLLAFGLVGDLFERVDPVAICVQWPATAPPLVHSHE
jgi:hypothetical protein